MQHKKIKTLLISNMYPSSMHPYFGTFVKNFEKQLEKEGYVFEKAVIKGRGRTKLQKVKKYIRYFMDVLRQVVKNDYELIYVHYLNHSLLPLLFMKSFVKKPLVLNAHGSDVLVISKLGVVLQRLVTPLIKKADLIVVPSTYFRTVVSNKFALPKTNIIVSPSGGIDSNLFKPFKTKKADIFTLGYVSRIDIGKGWDVLLDAIYLLKQKKINLNVLMVGSGNQTDLMQNRISELELNNEVEYVEAQPHDQLPNYFNQMDIFVFPTTRLAESLGLVGLEAMACGVPVIGANIAGLPSYIIDEINGKLFVPGDSKELSKCIEKLYLMTKDEFKIYQTQALETAKRYDSKIVAKELALKLKELLKSK